MKRTLSFIVTPLILAAALVPNITSAVILQNGYCWNDKVGWVSLSSVDYISGTRTFTGEATFFDGTHNGATFNQGTIDFTMQPATSLTVTLSASTNGGGNYPILGQAFSQQLGWLFANHSGTGPAAVQPNGTLVGNFWSNEMGWFMCSASDVGVGNTQIWDLDAVDTDGDGIPNDADPDIDGDGIPNEDDPDIDGDGIINVNDPDIDGDGDINTTDPDDDGDGTNDGTDTTPGGTGEPGDLDGDGIPDATDPDIDGDGIINANDPDIDGDGTNNGADTDDDGDGTNDGTDTTPGGSGGSGDLDGDGTPDLGDTDIDGDGIPNAQDPDIDGDGIVNALDPDIDGDGTNNGADTDDDGDGVADGLDTSPGGTGETGDIDGDGIPNDDDADMDGDGIPNVSDPDTDGDGVPNTSDTDDDNDGTNDSTDTSDTGLGTPTDIDGDARLNTAEDSGTNGGDGNGDGVLDSVQQNVSGASNPVTGQYSTLETDGACMFITENAFLAESSLLSSDPSFDYPVGLVDFKVQCSTPGSSTNVKIYYGQQYSTSGWSYKKYDSLGNEYANISHLVTFGTETVGSTIVTTASFTVTDGDPLTDEDATADGFINDPSGPAIPVSTPTTGGAGGGGGGGGSHRTLPPSFFNTATTVNTVTSGVSTYKCNYAALSQTKGYLQKTINAKAVDFTDVPVTQWYSCAINAAVDAGIVSGYKDAQGNYLGLFKPANTITYAEAVKVAVQLAKLPVVQTAVPNNTSAKGDWSAPYIAALEAHGTTVITKEINVRTAISRGAFIQLLIEALDIATNNAVSTFSDVPSTHPYAKAIATANALKYIQGDTDAAGKLLNTFRPNAFFNRAEAARIAETILLSN